MDSTLKASRLRIHFWDWRTEQITCLEESRLEDITQIHFRDWRRTEQIACLEESHLEDITQVHFVPGQQSNLVSASVDGLMCLFDTSRDINDDHHHLVSLLVGSFIN
ncbi:PREDICTED: uncharacterized protein LOC105948933 isoform X2 [Erythranthe guttata]|uniref:uncharacterized protein LOC105948933 isoform X2 n=1 Tax=Erythranthe guttata TaxID=4155 RepID=UPI00064DC526|nr:PREDICTED: uncharacterized protein LOC105948933 isoform X2 [Erythranthe guttata]|eukprot:XP_012827657.1 PREDICTED: uncharacterized protein LOC105948933 isoform X2 [Erythranthe guttata]